MPFTCPRINSSACWRNRYVVAIVLSQHYTADFSVFSRGVAWAWLRPKVRIVFVKLKIGCYTNWQVVSRLHAAAYNWKLSQQSHHCARPPFLCTQAPHCSSYTVVSIPHSKWANSLPSYWSGFSFLCMWVQRLHTWVQRLHMWVQKLHMWVQRLRKWAQSDPAHGYRGFLRDSMIPVWA